MLRGMWTSRLRPEALDLVDLVVGEVALEPEPARYTVLVLALPGQDVGGDAVEEPAVVGDDHGTSRELQEGVIEAREGLDIQVVGRLIEQEDVA